MLRILVSLFFLGLVQIVLGQNRVQTDLYNPMSNNLAVTLEGGLNIGSTDYSTIKPNYDLRGSLEYYFSSVGNGLLGVKGFAGTGIVSGKDNSRVPTIVNTDIYNLGAGLSYIYSINNLFYPYISAGVSSLWYFPFDNNGNKLPKKYDRQAGALSGELGIRYMLSENLSLNVASEMTSVANDYLDNIKVGAHNDFFTKFVAGISYYFGRDKDSDRDGVPDYRDACENTPASVQVDEAGCPLDSDHDGVPDYLDKCANTPPGVHVDANGCPLDADGDGVPDYLDKCPNTPSGAQVDASGCPLDADGDGVPDYLDKCPNTPAGVQVDANGCPLDADGDGVPDYLDKCPNTPKGTKVDANGCPVVKPIKKTFILQGDANFESGKAELLPNALPLLDTLALAMKENPNYTFEVDGFTDSRGSDFINIKLSGKRAKAVVEYLISKGVPSSMMTVKAFGKANPVASNKTAEGRAMNRRVEIRVISTKN